MKLKPISHRLNPRTRIHLPAVGVCVLLTAIAYAAGIRPQLAAAVRHADQADVIAEHDKKNQAMQATLDRLRQKWDSRAMDLGDHPPSLRPAAQLNQHLAAITDIASQAGVNVHRIQPDAPTHAHLYDVIPIRVAGTGTYRSSALFVMELHRRCPNTGITRMNLVSRNHQHGDQVEFDLGLAWYTSKSTNPNPYSAQEHPAAH